MLTEEEKQEIEETLQHYERRRSACVEVLKCVQQHRGWISDEALQDTAAILEMTPAELDAVATFYNLIFRQPVGKHIILICDSITCWIMGYGDLRKHLNDRLGIDLGGTTTDGRFTLLPTACLGACDHAPAMMVDDELYLDLDVEKVDRILEQCT